MKRGRRVEHRGAASDVIWWWGGVWVKIFPVLSRPTAYIISEKEGGRPKGRDMSGPAGARTAAFFFYYMARAVRIRKTVRKKKKRILAVYVRPWMNDEEAIWWCDEMHDRYGRFN